MSLNDTGQREDRLRWAAMNEGRSLSAGSSLLFRLYRVHRLRSDIIRVLKKREGGEFFSQTLRDLFAHYHDVHIGRYTYGCFVPESLPPGTVVGNYCSVASRLTVLRRNHPYARLSQHPFFYNRDLGLVEADTIEHPRSNPLVIGHDVWVGEGTVVLPGCQRIGDGAIIGAGTILTRDVEPFSIVGGNPGRKIRDRYSDELRAELEALEWWKMSITELLEQDFPFDQAVTPDLIQQMKAARRAGAA